MNNMPPMNQFNFVFPPNINQFNPFQNNFMAQNPININNMIPNYENRIRELEDKIKEKDIQITYLQEQLNNLMAQNSININNMIPNYENRIKLLEDKIKEKDLQIAYLQEQLNQKSDCISVAIQINDQIIQKIKCYKSQKASIIGEKLNLKNENIILTYNYKPIEHTKTIEENGIYDGAIINLTHQLYNVNFNKDGNDCIIPLDGECPLKTAIISYCEKYGEKNLYFDALNKKITFIFRSILDILDETPIKNIFNKCSNPKVNVLF